ncbi:ATR-interacting protein mus304 [Anopheles darlingi]|uniref:ATR-interacting protein mus304 n=1 Tax=Anopheles darlingi TaxID=43151 RepID=UPI00210004E5|nr:ATR-interacting protein mus304 [Anopheles darlingi]
MSKRAGHFQLKLPTNAKKAKLDIEITPTQQIKPSTSSTSSKNRPAKPSVDNASKIDALWGDEDDEFIVLASQAVEELEMFQQSQIISGTQTADLTFGKFSRQVKSSTQTVTISEHTSGVSKPPPLATDKLTAELFADGDDDIFTEKFDDNYQNIGNHIDNYFNNEFDEEFNLDEFRQEGQKPAVSGRIEPPVPSPGQSASSEFKTPALPPKMNGLLPTTSNGTSGIKPKATTANQSNAMLERARAEQEAKENVAKKQEHAKDIQLKFLTKRLEQIERKAETLQKDYNEALEKAQIRDGEVSMLRYELKTVKGTNEQLRMEKIREKETIKKEWVEKLKDLEKVVMAQKVDLDFKELEMAKLRTKHLKGASRSAEARSSDAPQQERVTEDSFILSSLLPQLTLDEVETDGEDRQLTLDPHVFEISSDGIGPFSRRRKFSNLSQADALMAHHLSTLQTVLSQIITQTNGSKSLPKLSAAMLEVVVQSSDQAFAEITQYCHRLAPAQVKDPESTMGGFDWFSGQLEVQNPINIFKRDELCPDEQGKVARRFLALLGLLCRISSELVNETLLRDDRISQLARSVKLLSNACTLLKHQGMVMGVAALLKGISYQFPRSVEANQPAGVQLLGLFRSIVLCQTDAPSMLVELSEFLRRMSEGHPHSALLIDELCLNGAPVLRDSSKKYRLKTISFSDETCTLQMYASLLEASVIPNIPYEDWQLRRLLVNVENTIRFLRNAMVRPARWVRNFVEVASSTSDSRVCELCHIRMVSACVVLMHRLLLCWHQSTVNEAEDIERLQSAVRNGTLLLFDVFHTAYRGKLLRLSGPAIQCRLRIVYNWLRMHQKEFLFLNVHSSALRMLDMRLLMNEPLKSHREKENTTDTAKEAEQTGDAEARRTLLEEMYTGFYKNKFTSTE